MSDDLNRDLSAREVIGLLGGGAALVAVVYVVFPWLASAYEELAQNYDIYAIAAVYFAPSIIALARRHQSELAIFALNILLGWTILGWIAALVWSLAAVRRPA